MRNSERLPFFFAAALFAGDNQLLLVHESRAKERQVKQKSPISWVFYMSPLVRGDTTELVDGANGFVGRYRAQKMAVFFWNSPHSIRYVIGSIVGKRRVRGVRLTPHQVRK